MTCCFLDCSVVIPTEKYKIGRDDEEELIGTENKAPAHVYKCRLTLANIWVGICKVWQFICDVWSSKKFKKCRKLTFIILALLIILAFVAAFVVFPLVFMNTYQMQKDMIYKPKREPHGSFEYDLCFDDYGGYNRNNKICGVNTMVRINRTGNDLGVWYISSDCNTTENCEVLSGTKPVIIYFHGAEGNRKDNSEIYKTLIKTFQIVTFDYRGYGDSTVDEMLDNEIVRDCADLYKWVQSKTNVDIFIMGERFGASIAAMTITKLHYYLIRPYGVFLVNPWYSLADEIQRRVWPFYQMCSWMPWFKSTFVEPMEKNGMAYETYQYVERIDSPILIIKSLYHYDDIGKLYRYILNHRTNLQGGVELKQLSYYNDNSIQNYIRDFINVCRRYNGPGNNITNYTITTPRYY